MFADIKNAISHYGEAIQLIREKKLGKLLLLSMLIYLLLFLLSAYFIWVLMNEGIEYVLNLSPIHTIKTWLSNMHWLLNLFKFGIFLSTFFLFMSIYKFIFLAVASPIYAYISEVTAEKISGKVYPFSLPQFFKDVMRGIKLSGINLVKQLFWTLVLFILSFIPLIGWIFSFLILLIDCYYYGFSMLDYTSERLKLSSKESRILISKRKGLAFGNGFIMYLSVMIPLLGVVIMAPISAIAATITYYKCMNHPTFIPSK